MISKAEIIPVSAVLLLAVMLRTAYLIYAVFGAEVPGPVSAKSIKPTLTLTSIVELPIRLLIVAISELNLVPLLNEALQLAELSRMMRTFGAIPVTEGGPLKISISSATAGSGNARTRHSILINRWR